MISQSSERREASTRAVKLARGGVTAIPEVPASRRGRTAVDAEGAQAGGLRLPAEP